MNCCMLAGDNDEGKTILEAVKVQNRSPNIWHRTGTATKTEDTCEKICNLTKLDIRTVP
jgi:hypothetical protein